MTLLIDGNTQVTVRDVYEISLLINYVLLSQRSRWRLVRMFHMLVSRKFSITRSHLIRCTVSMAAGIPH